MFRLKSRTPSWEIFPPDDQYEPRFTEEQRAFMKRALLENPTEKEKVKERMLAEFEAAWSAGRKSWAEMFLSTSMSLNGWNAKRIARDSAYWAEYQDVMLGQRVDRVKYLLGQIVPLERKARSR